MFDVCIIGSGPAGIITALEFTRLNPGKNAVLIEYGHIDQKRTNELDDTIQNVNPVNHHDPYECTNKGLGGTSATWGGRCVMYDKVDFIDRPILQGGCTWSTDLLEEVTNYLPQAANYFECGSSVFNLNDIPQFKNQRIAENFVNGVVTDSVLERWSMPTRFGKKYAKEIASRNNLTVLEGFEARDFFFSDSSDMASGLLIRNINTKETREIKAKTFVLAAGAQETTRILLRNPQLFESLGSPPTALGKYYQGHLSGKVASVKFKGNPNKTDFSFLRDEAGVYLRRRFQFSDEFLVKQNLLNTAIWLDNPLYYEPRHRSGPMSFIYLAMIMPFLGKRLAPPAIAHSVTSGKAHGVLQHIGNIMRGFPDSLSTPAFIFFKRYCLQRKLPGVFLFSPNNHYALHFHAEQVPDISNRMELGSDGETLVIHYSITDADIASVIRLHEVLDSWLKECGCGEIDYWYDKEELPKVIRSMSRSGLHQSGTTRMADSPDRGVVDRDLKLWGTENIFVCSSSVFPTSSQANPTFLLGAFAIRLAERLSKKQGNG